MGSWIRLSQGRNENLFNIKVMRLAWGILGKRQRRWIECVIQHWLKRTDGHTRKDKCQLREGPYLIKKCHGLFNSKVDERTNLHDPLGPDKHQPLAGMSCSNRGLKSRRNILISTGRSGGSAIGRRHFENVRCIYVETSCQVPR